MKVADLVLLHHHPLQPTEGDFDPLPTPPLDPFIFAAETEGADAFDIAFDDNYDFDLTFDDLDNFYLPSETEDFLIPDPSLEGCFATDSVNPASLESGSSGVSGGQDGSEIKKYLKCSPSESGSCNSGDGSSGLASARVVTNFPSPATSQGSGNVGSGHSGMSVTMNAASPDSGNFVVDQKMKIEEGDAKVSVAKRKKEILSSEEESCEVRNPKFRRSENAADSSIAVSEEEDKRKARLLRNRESAQLSRQRKKHYVEELEDKVRSMHSTIADLNNKISYFMAENATLRQQLCAGSSSSGNGMCPAPAMYPPPMAPVAYPWVPCTPYVVKPQGSQVPLVPIPRLKPQQPAPAAKPKKKESKKLEAKTKKVASISFLGLLFFVLLFGGLVPFVNVKYGGVRENGVSFVQQTNYDQHRGRVLTVDGHSNRSDENVGIGFPDGKFDVSNRVRCERGKSGYLGYDVEKKGHSERLPGLDEFVRLGNASEPLVASLYVPRNDKLVKIDGNLIIHSVMASEKAMASHEATEVINNSETGLAIPIDLALTHTMRGRHSHRYGTSSERQRALGSGSANSLKDHLKSSAADGKLQQWFREGLVGPMLSSGMCTEVFQFDVSPAPGAIIRASSVANITTENRQNTTHLNKGKSRRILNGLPVPLRGSKLNITGERVQRNAPKDNFQGNKSVSPMVVSVLVDPREAGDIDVDGVIRHKSLSRVFVVVLSDSVKYVTYSCMLPRSAPHLVRA